MHPGGQAMSFDPQTGKDTGWFETFLRTTWPYLLMLALALIGIALSSVMKPGRMIAFWEALVPAFALICFVTREKIPGESWLLAVRRDGLHWLAVFLAMRLLMLPDLSQMLNADALALMLLTVLALGTFTAGNQVGSWKIATVGILLAAAVPGVAWLERTVLLIGIVAIAAVCAVLFVRISRS